MADIWVISDTHFNHANILTFKGYDGLPCRTFSDVEHMNETMIANWNSVVKPEDKVYHLGDVFFGPKDWIERHWIRLNGKKRLIVGNHDNILYIAEKKMFQKIEMWRMFSEFNLLLTHVPVHESVLGERRFNGGSMINVHGHIHSNKSPSAMHKCVCVEQINYTPVNIDELRVK